MDLDSKILREYSRQDIVNSIYNYILNEANNYYKYEGKTLLLDIANDIKNLKWIKEYE